MEATGGVILGMIDDDWGEGGGRARKRCKFMNGACGFNFCSKGKPEGFPLASAVHDI